MYTKQTLVSSVAYLRRLLSHKRLVFVEGRKLGLPRMQLLRHDLSKFLPDEWRSGVAFHRDGTGNDAALRKHYARNRHHPQRWVKRGNVRPMPERFRLEMLADWRAMARERGNEVADWYEKKGHTFPFHADTRAWVEGELFGRVTPQTRVSQGSQTELPEDQNEP